MSEFGSRLKEERLRLDVNQDVFGGYGGVKRNAQVKYERGERSPDAGYLEALAQHGVDVAYVITGKRADAPPGGGKRLYKEPGDTLETILAVQNHMGLRFSADQLKAIVGYAFQHQADEKALGEFVRTAFVLAGTPLESPE